MSRIERSQERWLTPGVAGIGVASLLADAGHEITTSLLPSFLGTTLGAPAAALGAIEGLADGIAGVSRLAGGALADDPDRRRATAVGGYTATAVLGGLIGSATAVWQVGVLRMTAWASRGLRVPSRNALLADAVSPEAYGRAYGFERAMDNVGAIVGPTLALILVAVWSIRTALFLSIIPGLLAAIAIVFAIRRTPRRERRPAERLTIRFGSVLRGALRRTMIGLAAFELGNVAATLLILRATELLAVSRGSEAATSAALTLYIGYNAAAAFASVPAGRVTDRRGATFVLIIGITLFGAAYLGLATTGPSIIVLATCFLGAGVAIGCVETAEHAVVARLAPSDARGSAFGVLAAIQSFGNLAASGIAGLLWTFASPRLAFGYAATWMAIAVTLLGVAGSRTRRAQLGAGS